MVIASMLLSSMLFSSTAAYAQMISGVDGGPQPSEEQLSSTQIGSNIDYIFTGTGSGTLGATAFSNADFIITMWGNTGDVMDIGGGEVFHVIGNAAEVEIVGVGTASVIPVFRTFVNHNTDSVGFSSAGPDYYDLFGVPVDTYFLATNFGPVCVQNPFIGQFNIPTDAGNFIISSTSAEGCFVSQLKTSVGGELIPLETTMVLVSGAQYTAAWMIPAIVSAIGIAIVIARKF